jgi:hypothetical protein
LPILASRGGEIRRLLVELSDPKRRAGAAMRLHSLGARVVPHVSDELGRLDADARRALLEALSDVQTADAKALRRRLVRVETPPAPRAGAPPAPAREPIRGRTEGAEAQALDALRALPPPRPSERASVSRERGEAHLTLARAGSRLARKDLLLSLNVLGAERARLYCEAAGLIGDLEFLAPLARVAHVRPEAAAAIVLIASRERVTLRSKVVRNLEEPLRLIVARSIAGH